MMDNCCAPQWADFNHSPHVPSDNYFEVEHEVHEPQMHLKSISKSNIPFPYKEEDTSEQSISETKFDDSLEPESSECTNVAYFIPHDNKKNTGKEAKQDSLSKAMKNLKLDEKYSKIHQTWNIPVSEITSQFKVSIADHKMRLAVPKRMRNDIRMSETKNTVLGKSLAKNFQVNDIKKKSNRQNSSIKDNDELAIKLKDSSIGISEKGLSYKVVSLPRRQSNMFKTKKCFLGKSQSKVLTCQYRRQSLVKYRKYLNQFVSLAEAVSKFQNGTPQRFRTMSRKDMKPGPLMKMKKSPLKLTHPVSPALKCKQRTRQPTILSQQERERLEVQEMKKHQIKANPIPVNILKAPSVLRKVVKKPATVTEEFRLTQPKKTRHTGGPHTSMQQNHNHKEQKVDAPIIRSNSVSNGIKKEYTESAVENIKPMPFNFENRNKEFQTKKTMKLKTLHDQETNKVKAEFHARPAPKFTNITNPLKEQTNKKKVILPCPFSFEERNKCLAKKKHDHIKQIQEKDKKMYVFHANPVPNFKPVIVHGLSKEKEKAKNCSKEVATKQAKSCNNQENKQPNIMDNSILYEDTKKEDVKWHIISNESNTKQCKNIVDNAKSEKLLTTQKIAKFELKTDKRAKERVEFDEKIRKKEQELEMKRQEEEKSRLLKEKMERAELRKMAEVKARPMPVYKPVIVLKSTKTPTSPQSPAWAGRPKPKHVS